MSQNMASAIYNDLNLPDHVYMQSGNGNEFRTAHVAKRHPHTLRLPRRLLLPLRRRERAAIKYKKGKRAIQYYEILILKSRWETVKNINVRK